MSDLNSLRHAWEMGDEEADKVTAEPYILALEVETERLTAERDEARAQRDGLADAHGKNAHDGAKARGTVGKGHHCAWREVAEAMEQRARAALAALPPKEADDA